MNKDFGLPHYFDGGLKFGDPAQINYVKTLRAEYEEEERMKGEGKYKYRVRVYIEGEYCQDVYTSCESEAEDMVKEEFDMCYADLEFTYDAEELESE